MIRDDAGGMIPWLQWLHPIRLMVLEADSALATAILDSLSRTHGRHRSAQPLTVFTV